MLWSYLRGGRDIADEVVLQRRERAADAALYKVDPGFAVQMGYEPPTEAESLQQYITAAYTAQMWAMYKPGEVIEYQPNCTPMSLHLLLEMKDATN